jgi:hypothetical protein
MTLRSELHVPAVDEELVKRLAPLAAEIDGARPGEWEDLLDEFNRLSPVSRTFGDFQGVYGAEEHDVYVRRLLATRSLPTIPDLSRDDVAAAFQRILDPHCPDHERCFLLNTLALNLSDPMISDLVYWPEEYFGDGNNARNMTATEMADASLAGRAARGN